MTPLRQNSYKVVHDFLQTSPHVTFPVVDSALYPFTVINLSCEYDYMQSLVGPPTKSPNHLVGVVMGTLIHSVSEFNRLIWSLALKIKKSDMKVAHSSSWV